MGKRRRDLRQWIMGFGQAIVGRSAVVVVFPVAIEYLDNATKDCLPGFVDFERTGDRLDIVYSLRTMQLGELGTLRLSHIADKATSLNLSSVPRPTLKKRRQYPELYKKRKEHRVRLMQAYFTRLAADDFWNWVELGEIK